MNTASTTNTTSTFIVTGMTCGHCVSSVSEEIREIPGVDGVGVDLDSGQVVVTSRGALDPGLVHAAVEDAGYSLAS